jgi:hypothetical protein
MSANLTTTDGSLDFYNTTGHTFRFDAVFSGTPDSVIHANTLNSTAVTGPWLSIGSNPTSTLSGIGFWTGTSLSHTISNGGKLWLGPATGGQSGITLTASGNSDQITVANYLCSGDTPGSTTFPIVRGHGVLFNVGAITNNTKTSGQIEVKNDQPVSGSIQHGDSINPSAWLKIDAAAALPALYGGNAAIWAEGNVYFLNDVNITAAKETHNIYSRKGSLVWNRDYAVASAAPDAYENYHADGDGDNAIMLAHGKQSYTFSGNSAKLDMVTQKGRIEMKQTFAFAGNGGNNNLNLLGDGGILVGDAVDIKTKDTGHARFYSGHGYVRMGSTLRHVQQDGRAGKGLTLLADGDVQINGSVSLTNTGAGQDTIRSGKDRTLLNQGIAYTGKDGNLWIDGYAAVNISGRHDGQSLPTGITLDVAGGGNESVYLYRTGTGSDTIRSSDGHVAVENAFTYVQTVSGQAAGLSVYAGGHSSTVDEGYLRISGSVTTRAVSGGTVNFTSAHHYVALDGGFVHYGEEGNMTVRGHSYVDVNNSYPSASTQHLVPNISLPQKSGAVEGVYISRNGNGRDSILSDNGHVKVSAPFTYQQQSGNTGGLTLLAQGPDEAVGDVPDRGYVWLQNDVWTEASDTVAIRSDNHYIRIGGRFTHRGAHGDLQILAKGVGETGCTPFSPEKNLFEISEYDEAHDHRGYVRTGDDVKITMAGNDPAKAEGNAVIRSYGDVVHLGDSVTFTDTQGANLWIDGRWGIRAFGPVYLTNSRYDGLYDGESSVIEAVYHTGGRGFATWRSESGYIDFGTAPHLSSHNTPFRYTAADRESALLLEGNSRVFFGDSATIRMGGNVSASAAPAGNAKIYSPAGWIKFADTLGYTGTEGDLLIYAAGDGDGAGRSCPDDDLTCDPHGGFILFDGVTEISYPAAKDTGTTWIRSHVDDIIIGNRFAHTSAASPNPEKNGRLIMQAGQDIYGKSPADTLHFVHPGESGILLEAQKTVRLQQMLLVDRSGARRGDMTFKAGYPTFAEPSTQMASHGASHKDATPAATLVKDASYWPKGDDNACNYTDRHGSNGVMQGGDLWFEGRVLFDLTQSATTGNEIATTLRAYHSIFIDSTFVYRQNVAGGGDVLLFAETGNIEAIVTRRDDAADDTVLFDVRNPGFDKEIRIQAGNRVWDGTENDAPASDYWENVSNPEFSGNILFNKPFLVRHAGTGATILSASRDIETQVTAPFFFTCTNAAGGRLDITAGRHVETHARMQFDCPAATAADVVIEAGRLNPATQTADAALGKTAEEGSSLTNGGGAFVPDVQTGDGVHQNNAFAAGGRGNGSILLFDSLEFNCNGAGKILLIAENGNIESDPYLHKGLGQGYSHNPLQHDAQITFNRGGTGITQLKAIDIRLHDKIFYYASQSAQDKKNGRLYLTAYDSILTRNLQYVNPTDTGSVFITTAKYKPLGGDKIVNGHIVLGYGGGDSIVFDFKGNPNVSGANVFIRAGYDGFEDNPVTGVGNSAALFAGRPDDAGKGYGGNITFDCLKADMAEGNHAAGGYLEIATPNGNIWGKDLLDFNARNGDLMVDAGLGSQEDAMHGEDLLNTCVPFTYQADGAEWRTGNIMMKGAALDFNDGTGNATFRTREGFIDTYDAFTASSMEGHILKYAGMDDAVKARRNKWGDVSERDFRYLPTANSGSVFFGADDNIMLNYGNSNSRYDAAAVYRLTENPFYYTVYEGYVDGLASTYSVNTDGYLFYKSYPPNRQSHLLYRGCTDLAGVCRTTANGARDLTFDFRNSVSGGLALVASNYIDLFTKFDYYGGTGSGLHAVPGRATLHGEAVAGYGLYIKSQFNGDGSNYPEHRRATCDDCGTSSFPIEGSASRSIHEMTYIGFHDDARIHTNNQPSLLEAPVIEFFGAAELDTETGKGSRTRIVLKGDSLIFHDSAIFHGNGLELSPFTVDASQRLNDMRYGVVNDRGKTREHYSVYGAAIEMEDRGLPALELGYGRCCEPGVTPVGDVTVAFKQGFRLPVFNTVVANNARISFLTDDYDGVGGGEYTDAFVRADLLRIRNNVEFYADPQQLVMTAQAQLDDDRMAGAGMYTRHLHLDPGGELSLSGRKPLVVTSSTVVGGYGKINEDLIVKAGGIVAPGRASLMEGDCRTPLEHGTLTVSSLEMEKDAVLRIAIANRQVNSGDRSETAMPADVIHVEDRVFFTDNSVLLEVLPESAEETFDAGSYVFMTYDDTSGASGEYVRNFVLVKQRYGENYFTLDFSEAGKVKLTVTKFPEPEIRRYVDLPEVEGVTTNPEPRRHYVKGHEDFEFAATFSGAPLKVQATGFYSGQTIDLDETAKSLGGDTRLYTIYQVTEPWTVFIGPEPASSDVSNALPPSLPRVWAIRNTLCINAGTDETASIYTMSGVLRQRTSLSEGLHRITLERGLYIVTLKDGSAHRILIR